MTRRQLFIVLVISVLLGVTSGFLYWTLSGLPNVKMLEEYAPLESSRIYSSDGAVLAELYLERRTFLPYYQVPDHVKKAFIAVEDIRFYQHPGVDVIGIMRALWRDVKAGGIVEGGSTITQQLARMLFLSPDKSIKRKIREAVLSILIEQRYTKDEILGMYLNQTYFGTRAYGIEAASQTYFGKATQDLSIADAALLASIPKSPSRYSPFRNPEKAKSRRDTALKLMLDYDFITLAQYNEAVNMPLPKNPYFRKYDAPYFVELLRQQLEGKFGTDLYTSGYQIYSTLDAGMQKAAEDAVTAGLTAIEKRVNPGVEAALVAMDYRTGHIKAMVGGSNFWQNQFNRATQALRQPGSAFKPFVFMAAIENGMTSSDLVNDSPVSFPGAKAGQRWIPRNYDGKYYGPVTLTMAFAKSLNCATIRLAADIGVEGIVAMAKRLGIRSQLQPYLPLAIGASDVTLIDIVHAYSSFVSGHRPKIVFYERILNRNGITVEENKPVIEHILSEEDVQEMKILLKAVVDEGTGVGALNIKRPAFGKTGTTNDYTDAWFIGFDENLIVGVWVGRDNHMPIGEKETGARAALPIWTDFMKKVPLRIPAAQNP